MTLHCMLQALRCAANKNATEPRVVNGVLKGGVLNQGLTIAPIAYLVITKLLFFIGNRLLIRIPYGNNALHIQVFRKIVP